MLNNYDQVNGSMTLSQTQRCDLSQSKRLQQLINQLQLQQIQNNVVIKSREEKDEVQEIQTQIRDGEFINIDEKIKQYEEEQNRIKQQQQDLPTYQDQEVETEVTLEKYDKTIEDYHYYLEQNEQKDTSISNLNAIRYNQSEEIKELNWKLKDNIKQCQQLKQQLKQTQEDLKQQTEEANEQFLTQETNYNELKNLYEEEQQKYSEIQQELANKIDIINQLNTMKNSVNTLGEVISCVNDGQFENAEQMVTQIINILKAGEIEFQVE